MNLKENFEKSSNRCVSCTQKDCVSRPLGIYIHDIGIDYFCYQLENDKLPIQVRKAIIESDIAFLLENLSFLDFLKTLL